MKTLLICCLSLLLSVLLIFSVKAQNLETTNSETEYSTYKNRVSVNLLGLPAANLVTSYERTFKNQSVWLGFNYHLNGLLKEEERNMSSLAVEYRYYFFANKSHKYSNGLFGGLYAKYRRGEETKEIIYSTSETLTISHSYRVLFAGLNVGYRYNYKRLALSTFVGYGFLITNPKENQFEVFDANGKEVKLNEGYKQDLRLGVTVGFAF